MPESLCTRTSVCMQQADCPDSHCHGRWQDVQLHLRNGFKVCATEPTRAPAPRRRFVPITREARGRLVGALLALGGLGLFWREILRAVFTST